MTAHLVYEIIMTLTENERDKLLDMLSPYYEELDLDELISMESKVNFDKQEMTDYLIKRLFSKVKKTNS